MEVGPLAAVEVLVLCFPVVRPVVGGVESVKSVGQQGMHNQKQRNCFVEQQGMRQLPMSYFVVLENP